ncbi:hypothetical protein Esti_006630 [Eimeria stiedai]
MADKNISRTLLSEKKGQRDVREPMAEATLLTSMKSMAAVDRLAFARRGEGLECHVQQQQQQRKEQEPLQATRPASVRLVYRLAEVLFDFTDRLLSAASGAATFDAQEAGKRSPSYEFARITSVTFLVNGQPVDVLGLLVHHTREACVFATRFTERLSDLIPPQQFDISLQGAVDGRMVARARIRAFQKDVTAKASQALRVLAQPHLPVASTNHERE